MTDAEKREAARQFYQKWANRGREDEDDRSYWIDFLQDVMGIDHVTDRIEFQKKVVGPDGNTKRIDAYIPETHVLIEQKSRNVDLSKPQQGHDGMTPYQQAKMYDNSLPVSEKAKWIIISNFAEIWIKEIGKTPRSIWIDDGYLMGGTGGTRNTKIIPLMTDLQKSENVYRVYIPDLDDNFQINAGSIIDHSITFNNQIVEIESKNSGTVYIEDGEVKTEVEGSGITTRIVSNDSPISSPEIIVDAPFVNELSVKKMTKGYLIEGSSLSDIKLTERKNGQETNKEISTEYKTILVGEENGGIVVYADKDGDGEYNDVIESDPQPEEVGIGVKGLNNEGYPYTGSSIKPNIEIYDGERLLKEKRDYSLSYRNNNKVYTIAEGESGFDAKKAPSITITGKGNYNSKETLYFKILPKDISGDEFSSDNMVLAYSGRPQKIAPALYYNGKPLKKDKDFSIQIYKYSDNENNSRLIGETVTDVGDYQVEFSGKGNYEKTRVISLKVVNDPKLVNNLSVDKITNMSYTGKEIQPDPVVKDKGTVLIKGTHYSLTYASNINPGTGYVIITGIPENGYSGTKRVSFKITTSKPATSTPYDISPEKDVEDRIKIECDRGAYYIKGGEAKPEVTVKYTDEKGKTRILVENIDYKLSYLVKDSANYYAYVVITGKGDFTGSRQQIYFVSPKNLDIVTIKADDKPYQDKPNIFPTKVELIDTNGKKLVAGKDYYADLKYAYLNDTYVSVNGNREIRKAGTEVGTLEILPVDTVVKVTATAAPRSGYTDRISTTYRIVRDSISKAKISIPAQTYTGKPIELDPTTLTVSVKGQKLTTSDFEIVSYENRINKGTAKVTIRGKGNYGGYKTQTFKIKAKGFRWWWRK